MKKKIIAVLLSVCMLVSACPTGAFAMSDEETNTYAATGDVMQGGTPVVDETPRARGDRSSGGDTHSRSGGDTYSRFGGDTHSRPGRDPGSR